MKRENKLIVLFSAVAALDASFTAIGVAKTSILNEINPVAVWFYKIFSAYGFYVFGIVNILLFWLMIRKSKGFCSFLMKHESKYVFALAIYTIYTGLAWARVVAIGTGLI